MGQRPVRLLLIDDDEGDFFLTRDLLNEIPGFTYVLDWVAEYQAALDAICRNDHDVVLLDYRLGQHTGLGLLREATRRGCTGPIILLTGQGERDVDVAAMEAGAADYLEKSKLDAATLDRVIRYTVQERRHLTELEKRVADRTMELAQTNAVLHSEIAERQRVQEALRETETRFRHLADAMPQIVWIVSAAGALEFINRRWTQYTGLTMEQTRDRARFKEVVHPDDVALLISRAQEAAVSGVAYQVEFRVRRASDGLYHWFLGRGVPVRDDKGTIIRWYGTSTDIDDQKRAEEMLRQADRRKDDLLATLAHELRNPLPPIRNALEIMRLAANNPAAIERCRAMIERQVQQLVRVIDDLLDISRITRGKLQLRKELVDLASVVQSALETCQPIIEEHGHKLTVTLPSSPVMLVGDSTRLAQVLVNLLNNAAKYTDQGGEIRLTAEQQDGHVAIRVRDTGIGIPAEMLAHIFEKFTQVGRPEERSQGGLGIGLALVQTLVQMHGGSVEVHSEGPGRGSEFTVSLPVFTASEPAASAGRAGLRREAASPGS